jgi:predicted metal-binding protein
MSAGRVRVTADDVAAIARMFRAVDAIDADVARDGRPLPLRRVIPCPNCPGRLAYVQLTAIKGAARCTTPGCVDFAPVAPVAV